MPRKAQIIHNAFGGTVHEIVDVIPPRPGSKVGTIVLADKNKPPVKSVTVKDTWMRSTHVRIGGSVSFHGTWIRYHWEMLPIELQEKGVMDELFPSDKRVD
jgi:hypothetical protein